MPETNEEIERFLVETCCPIGHRYTLVMISITKRWLAMELPAFYRLKFLEHLDKMTTGDGAWLTAEMIAAIEPVCDKGHEMVCEANKLGDKALDAYAKFFSTFAVLNPSLIAALKNSPRYAPQYAARNAASNAIIHEGRTS